MWHFNRIAQGCLKCMPMIPVISWQPGHGSLSAHFSPVSSTEDKHLVANFEQVAQTRNDVTATSNPHRSLSCCNATGGRRKGRGAFPHLTALHADFVEAWKVDGLFRGCRRQQRRGWGAESRRKPSFQRNSEISFDLWCHMDRCWHHGFVRPIVLFFSRWTNCLLLLFFSIFPL